MLTLIQRSVCYSVFFKCFILWTSICSDAERLFHQRDHSDLQSENQQRAEPITDPHTAEMFLSRYGFLRPVNWEELLLDDRDETDLSFLDLHEFSIEEGASLPHSRQTDQNHDNNQKPHDPHFANALRDFQKLSGLPVTGVLDEATKDAMNKPRCGVPDVEAELGEVEITDDKSLQEKPNSKSVGFQHLDDINVEMLDKNSSGDDLQRLNEANNHFDDLSKETNSKITENYGSMENHASNETKIETHKRFSDLKNLKNISTNYNDSYNGSGAFEDDLPSTDHETNQKFPNDFKLLDVLLGTMDKRATETEGIPLNQSNESNTFTDLTNGDSNMTFPSNSVLHFSGNSSKNSHLSGINLDFSDNFDPMSNQTFIDRSDHVISNTNDSQMGNLNQTFQSSYNHSDGYLLDNKSANFANERNLLFDPNLNHTASIKASGNSFNLTFENETAFVDNRNRFGDFSFNQRVNNLKDYNTENSTFSDDVTNETKSNFKTNSDPVSKDATQEKTLQSANETRLSFHINIDTTAENSSAENVHQNLNKTAFETKENSTTDNVPFESLTNDTSLETKHQAITKQLIKSKTTIVDVNLENKNGTTLETKHQTIAEKMWILANETNVNSSIDSDTTERNTHQNGNKMAFESKDIFTFDDFENFTNETNLNSLTIFDSIDSNTSVENIHQNVKKTAMGTKENSTIDNVNFENFTSEANVNSPTMFDKTDNATSAETKLQTIAKNSTFDYMNFENFANETNLNSPTIFDSIDINTTMENIHQIFNKKAIKTEENSTFHIVSFENLTIFDKINNATYGETKLQTIDKNSTKTEENSTIDDLNFENFINETNLNSLIFFDSNDSNTYVGNIHQNVNKTKKNSTFDNMDFENFTNKTNLNSPIRFDKTDNATSEETKIQTIGQNSTKNKENSTFDDINFENFTNETNLNSLTISDPINNATSTETKHQTVTKKPTESTDLARRKRHLATLVSKSRARKRREVGGHVAFSKSVLRWRLIGEGYSSQLSVEEQRYVFRLAFRMWSEVCPLEFTEDNASPLEEIDIRLGFGTGRHLGCKQRFDGSGREFAHAWFLGDIHFDDDEHFSGSSAGRGISLLKVAVHEIGHVLGLPHIYRPGSIMQPSYRPHESGFEVDWMDRKAIQSLYGGCKGRFDAVFDWVHRERSPRGDVVIRFNTYFMRRGWYWLYENRNNRTRFGDPVSLQSGWRGLPLDGVDAFVHVWSRRRDHVYFFKGAQFWSYDGEQDQVLRRDPDGRSYPRPISEGFPGVPAPIDTAVYDRRDGNIYFFKGRLVYAFSVDSNRLARGFPKPLRSVFPALDPRDHPESGLDAAYFSYTHNALFLLKDTRFWRVAGGRERRTGRRLRKNTLLPHREIDQQWFDICNVHPSALRLTP